MIDKEKREIMKLEPNVTYVVTKPSDDGSFRLGEHIILKDDGRIWIGEDLVEPEGIPIAVVGLEVEIYNADYRTREAYRNANNTYIFFKGSEYGMNAFLIRASSFDDAKVVFEEFRSFPDNPILQDHASTEFAHADQIETIQITDQSNEEWFVTELPDSRSGVLWQGWS